MEDTTQEIEGDLLLGANAIAKFLGISSRQVYRLTYDGTIPHFKLGGTVSARRSSLTKWMDELESNSKTHLPPRLTIRPPPRV